MNPTHVQKVPFRAVQLVAGNSTALHELLKSILNEKQITSLYPILFDFDIDKNSHPKVGDWIAVDEKGEIFIVMEDYFKVHFRPAYTHKSYAEIIDLVKKERWKAGGYLADCDVVAMVIRCMELQKEKDGASEVSCQ